MSSAKSPVSIFVAFVLVLGVASRADAGLVSTSQALELERQQQARTTVDAYLARDEVAAELTALGVDPEAARQRAAALSPSEIAALAGRIAEAPAGGTSVIAVLGVTFLVLLILELVGVIDIFKKL